MCIHKTLVNNLPSSLYPIPIFKLPYPLSSKPRIRNKVRCRHTKAPPSKNTRPLGSFKNTRKTDERENTSPQPQMPDVNRGGSNLSFLRDHLNWAERIDFRVNRIHREGFVPRGWVRFNNSALLLSIRKGRERFTPTRDWSGRRRRLRLLDANGTGLVQSHFKLPFLFILSELCIALLNNFLCFFGKIRFIIFTISNLKFKTTIIFTTQSLLER